MLGDPLPLTEARIYPTTWEDFPKRLETLPAGSAVAVRGVPKRDGHFVAHPVEWQYQQAHSAQDVLPASVLVLRDLHPESEFDLRRINRGFEIRPATVDAKLKRGGFLHRMDFDWGWRPLQPETARQHADAWEVQVVRRGPRSILPQWQRIPPIALAQQ